MNTPSIICKDNVDDSREVSTKMSSVTIKTTEKPKITISTTLLPVKLTTTFTTTSIVEHNIKPDSNSTSKVNNTTVQPNPNSDIDYDIKPANNRKIEHLMVKDAIEYTCFKMDYTTGTTKLSLTSENN